MSLDKIGPRMIHNPVKPGTSLYEGLKGKHTISVLDCGYVPGEETPSIETAIAYGTDFLIERGYGTLEIVPTEGLSQYTSYVDIVKEGSVTRKNYRFSNYRYPINSEGRPLGGSFEIGDIIQNTNITQNKCLGWVCISGGRPGIWKAFGLMQNWYSEIEKLHYLPEPSPLQEGRQIYLTSGTPRVYICKHLLGEYGWYPVEHSCGSTSQRPKDNLLPGLVHFNTTLGRPEWFNGEKWVTGALTEEVGTSSNLTTEDKTLSGAINELDKEVGDLSALTTIDKSSLVNALNEWGADKRAFKLASEDTLTFFNSSVSNLEEDARLARESLAQKTDKLVFDLKIGELEDTISENERVIGILTSSTETMTQAIEALQVKVDALTPEE